MADERDALPLSRIARWGAVAVLILSAVLLHFRDGRRVPPLGHAPAEPPPPTTR